MSRRDDVHDFHATSIVDVGCSRFCEGCSKWVALVREWQGQRLRTQGDVMTIGLKRNQGEPTVRGLIKCDGLSESSKIYGKQH